MAVEGWKAAASWRWRAGKLSTGENNADGNDGAIELCFMHMGDCRGSIRRVVVEDVGRAAVRVDYLMRSVSGAIVKRKRPLMVERYYEHWRFILSSTSLTVPYAPKIS